MESRSTIYILIRRLSAPSRPKHFHRRSALVIIRTSAFAIRVDMANTPITSEPSRQSEGYHPNYFSGQDSKPRFVSQSMLGKNLAMLSRICFAYAVMSGHALPAVLSGASQIANSQTTSPVLLTVPEDTSAMATNASASNDVPTLNLSSLGTVTEQESNRSSSISNSSFGHDLPVVPRPILRCNSDLYGTDLNRLSCFDAWRNLGRLPDAVRWGPRGLDQTSPYRLPYRWSSGT